MNKDTEISNHQWILEKLIKDISAANWQRIDEKKLTDLAQQPDVNINDIFQDLLEFPDEYNAHQAMWLFRLGADIGLEIGDPSTPTCFVNHMAATPEYHPSFIYDILLQWQCTSSPLSKERFSTLLNTTYAAGKDRNPLSNILFYNMELESIFDFLTKTFTVKEIISHLKLKLDVKDKTDRNYDLCERGMKLALDSSGPRELRTYLDMIEAIVTDPSVSGDEAFYMLNMEKDKRNFNVELVKKQSSVHVQHYLRILTKLACSKKLSATQIYHLIMSKDFTAKSFSLKMMSEPHQETIEVYWFFIEKTIINFTAEQAKTFLNQQDEEGNTQGLILFTNFISITNMAPGIINDIKQDYEQTISKRTFLIKNKRNRLNSIIENVNNESLDPDDSQSDVIMKEHLLFISYLDLLSKLSITKKLSAQYIFDHFGITRSTDHTLHEMITSSNIGYIKTLYSKLITLLFERSSHLTTVKRLALVKFGMENSFITAEKVIELLVDETKSNSPLYVIAKHESIETLRYYLVMLSQLISHNPSDQAKIFTLISLANKYNGKSISSTDKSNSEIITSVINDDISLTIYMNILTKYFDRHQSTAIPVIFKFINQLGADNNTIGLAIIEKCDNKQIATLLDFLSDSIALTPSSHNDVINFLSQLNNQKSTVASLIISQGDEKNTVCLLKLVQAILKCQPCPYQAIYSLLTIENNCNESIIKFLTANYNELTHIEFNQIIKTLRANENIDVDLKSTLSGIMTSLLSLKINSSMTPLITSSLSLQDVEKLRVLLKSFRSDLATGQFPKKQINKLLAHSYHNNIILGRSILKLDDTRQLGLNESRLLSLYMDILEHIANKTDIDILSPLMKQNSNDVSFATELFSSFSPITTDRLLVLIKDKFITGKITIKQKVLYLSQKNHENKNLSQLIVTHQPSSSIKLLSTILIPLIIETCRTTRDTIDLLPLLWPLLKNVIHDTPSKNDREEIVKSVIKNFQQHLSSVTCRFLTSRLVYQIIDDFDNQDLFTDQLYQNLATQYKDSAGKYILDHLADNADKLDLLQCVFDDERTTSRLRTFFYEPRGQFNGTPDKSNLQSPLGKLYLKWLLLELKEALTEEEIHPSFILVTDIKTLLKGQFKHPLAFIRNPDGSRTTFLNCYMQLFQLAGKKSFSITYRECAIDIMNSIRNGKCQINEACTSNDDKQYGDTFITILLEYKSLLQRSERYINDLRLLRKSDPRHSFFNRDNLISLGDKTDVVDETNHMPSIFG